MNRLFVAVVCAWVAALPIAALLSGTAESLPAVLFVDAVYTCGRAVCHQRPERSFLLAGTPLPVCARCTGLYAGAAVVALVLAARRRSDGHRSDPDGGGRRQDAARRVRAVLAVAAVPVLLTLLVEWTTGQTPAGLVRAISAAPLGGAVAWTVFGATRDAVQSE